MHLPVVCPTWFGVQKSIGMTIHLALSRYCFQFQFANCIIIFVTVSHHIVSVQRSRESSTHAAMLNQTFVIPPSQSDASCPFWYFDSYPNRIASAPLDGAPSLVQKPRHFQHEPVDVKTLMHRCHGLAMPFSSCFRNVMTNFLAVSGLCQEPH